MHLETRRLSLDSATTDDAPLLRGLFSRPEVLRYLPPGPPWTLETAIRSIARRDELERARGFAPLLVRDRGTGRFLGSAGLQPIPNSTEVELAYHFEPAAWGRGFATEAAIALLEYGFARVPLQQIIAICVPENVGSWRVMEKAGMRYVGTASYYGLDGLRKYTADRGTWRNGAGAPFSPASGAAAVDRTSDRSAGSQTGVPP